MAALPFKRLMAQARFCLGAASLLPGSPSSRGAGADTVVMRQVVVEASHADWLYVSGPGWELVSRCGPQITRWYAEGLFREPLLDRDSPGINLLARPAVPSIYILYAAPPDGDESAGILPGPMTVAPARSPFFGPIRPWPEVFGDDVVFDKEIAAVVANFWHWRPRGLIWGDFGLLPVQLAQTVPPFPDWFAAALDGPFGISNALPLAHKRALPAMFWVSRQQVDAAIAASRARAVSAAQRALLDAPDGVVPLQPFLVEAKTRIQLLPMAELFRERGPDEGPPPMLWRAQAGLFVRWALFGVPASSPLHAAHREAFDRLLARSRREPVTEEIFRQCYGFGYPEMQEQLIAYLQRAGASIVSIPYQHIEFWPPPIRRFTLRPATEWEVGRMIGDWQRMKGESLKDAEPALAQRYLAEAGKLLRRVCAAGVGDPGLLAVYGLYEFDMGNATAAESLLEASVRGHVVRPAAYVALARIWLRQAEGGPEAGAKELSEQKERAILGLMRQARAQAMLPDSAYETMIEAMAGRRAKPAADDLALLQEGVLSFPRDVKLAADAAELAERIADPDRARLFARTALVFAQGAQRKRLLDWMRTHALAP